MPAESKTSVTCSGGGGAGTYRDLTVGGGGGGGCGTNFNDYQNPVVWTETGGWAGGIATAAPYTIDGSGFYSGTSSVQTVMSHPKDGEIHMNPETLEFSIYLSEYNKWIPCEIEELRKEKDKDGNIKNIVSVSFGCSVAQMKKKQRERIVMFEKFKKVKPLWTFMGNTITLDGVLSCGYDTYAGATTITTTTYP